MSQAEVIPRLIHISLYVLIDDLSQSKNIDHLETCLN